MIRHTGTAALFSFAWVASHSHFTGPFDAEGLPNGTVSRETPPLQLSHKWRTETTHWKDIAAGGHSIRILSTLYCSKLEMDVSKLCPLIAGLFYYLLSGAGRREDLSDFLGLLDCAVPTSGSSNLVILEGFGFN